MYQLLFRNRWLALTWAGITMAAIAAFVSEGGGTDKLDDTAQEVREQRAMMAGKAPPTFVEEAPVIDDAALIDPATGYDPTPMDDTNPEGMPKIVKKGISEQPAEAE